MARRWPVLHLANEKSVPFDVARLPAPGGSHFSTVSSASPISLRRTRVPLALRSRSHRARPVSCPLLLCSVPLRDRTLFLRSPRYIFSICRFNNRQGRTTRAKPMEADHLVVALDPSASGSVGRFRVSFFYHFARIMTSE